MKKILVVLKRELIARVRTRAFIISTLLLPIMLALFAVMPALLSRGGNRTLRVAIVDATGDSLGARIEAALGQQRLSRDSSAIARYELHRVRVGAAGLAGARDSLVAHTGISRERDPRAL